MNFTCTDIYLFCDQDNKHEYYGYGYVLILRVLPTTRKISMYLKTHTHK